MVRSRSKSQGEVTLGGKQVYSICGMCTVRCPIQVEVQNDRYPLFRGIPMRPVSRERLCARGGAGAALIDDEERPQYPLIRTGKRGEGQWRRVSWEEALDYTAARLQEVMGAYGAKTVLFSDRGGPFRDLHQAFMRGLGSPNYSNHDSACARNVQHAALSVIGGGRKEVVYDYKNARHVVLQTRNIFEAINVKEVNDLVEGMARGCKLTVIDIRANISATKADRFLLIRPGTDYALNLAVIHELLTHKLYDAEFAQQWINDLDKLAAFVKPYTPEWAAGETGIDGHGDQRLCPGPGRGQPRGHLASRLDERPVPELLLPVPDRLPDQRPVGQYRGQGRAAGGQ